MCMCEYDVLPEACFIIKMTGFVRLYTFAKCSLFVGCPQKSFVFKSQLTCAKYTYVIIINE